jgi:hypothetical protein
VSRSSAGRCGHGRRGGHCEAAGRARRQQYHEEMVLGSRADVSMQCAHGKGEVDEGGR